jgi:hypothetical protein
MTAKGYLAGIRAEDPGEIRRREAGNKKTTAIPFHVSLRLLPPSSTRLEPATYYGKEMMSSARDSDAECAYI